jgi:hypothetical protein
VSGLIVQIPDPVACHHLSVYLSVINYCGDCESLVSVVISLSGSGKSWEFRGSESTNLGFKIYILQKGFALIKLIGRGVSVIFLLEYIS